MDTSTPDPLLRSCCCCSESDLINRVFGDFTEGVLGDEGSPAGLDRIGEAMAPLSPQSPAEKGPGE